MSQYYYCTMMITTTLPHRLFHKNHDCNHSSATIVLATASPTMILLLSLVQFTVVLGKMAPFPQ
jgi:hypothetical protein